MRELSVAEQRYQAVLAVVGDGETVTDVAARFGVPGRPCIRGWPSTRPAGSRPWRAGRTGRGRVGDLVEAGLGYDDEPLVRGRTHMSVSGRRVSVRRSPGPRQATPWTIA